MTIAEQIYEKLKNAPPGLAQRVLNYVEFLEARMQAEEHKATQSDNGQSGQLLVDLMANSSLREVDFDRQP